MRFGLFGGAAAPRLPDVAASAQGFFDFIDTNVEAEALGFHSSFVTEHHFTGIGQVSATLTLLTFLAARTRRLRLGTAILVLPWHNPVLLAEQVATLDLLSRGRLDLGVGKGYRHNEFAGFAMPPDEAEPRFEEVLDVLVRALSSNVPFSHHGRFFRFNKVIVEPPPHQWPHPPLWQAASSEASISACARRGFSLLLDQFASPQQIGERIALYRASSRRQATRSSRCALPLPATSSSRATPRRSMRPSDGKPRYTRDCYRSRAVRRVGRGRTSSGTPTRLKRIR